MAKLLVVRGRDDFAALSRHGRRVREGPLTVVHLPRPEPARVSFAVGRRAGPAVVRNRLRRRLRAAWRELVPATGDYLIVAAPGAADLGFDELRSGLRRALERLEGAA
ncbi:MAG TPA: ribonuclease P protein component [Acidimicrobiales bacterium]|nr:ribonuclease P protein component [Acidimicrobiales bacterium]